MAIRILEEPNVPRIYSYTKDNFVVPLKYNVVRFYSYGRIIADWDNTTKVLIIYDDTWDYSNTTRRYFKQFINEYTDYEYEDKKKFEKLLRENA